MKLIITIVLSFLSTFAFAFDLTATVIAIHDGDTMQVKIAGEKKAKKIRLMGLDTPETDYLGQSQGESAVYSRDYLISLVPIGSSIQIDLGSKNTDIHNRLLGHIYYQGQDINQKMLASGMAFFYFIYPFDKSYFVKYSEAAKNAEEKNLGLFQKKFENVEEPYLFRQKAQGLEGANLVGNYETKTLYSQKEIALVPLYLRVFFSNFETAKKLGYKLPN